MVILTLGGARSPTVPDPVNKVSEDTVSCLIGQKLPDIFVDYLRDCHDQRALCVSHPVTPFSSPFV